ncbi:MAG: hypothetical protein J6J17_05545 [Bacilli bacterium]|nr:hypothetical protein [Bacilli bacterium]
MAKEHLIPITNGKGSKELSNGNYTVSANVNGYDNSTILPLEQEITQDINEYSFTISAAGTLTLHVSDDGTDVGVPIEGAVFYRCDSSGATYGDPITTDVDGNAIFNFVPYSDTNAPIIYFKQIQSDGEHDFNAELQNTTLDTETKTLEIMNQTAAERQINLTDANYSGLPIEEGNITLTA